MPLPFTQFRMKINFTNLFITLYSYFLILPNFLDALTIFVLL